jgi:hypothetical protein
MKYFLGLSLTLFIISKTVFSIDDETASAPQTRYVYLIVPGQGNFGGTKHDGKLPQTIPAHYKEIIRLKTPSDPTTSPFANFSSNNDDFGQQECQRLLHEDLNSLFNESNIKFIIHAYSQGTASILNYISILELADQNNTEKRTSKIEALILESVMISGFSAIHHYTSNHFRSSFISAGGILSLLPYSDCWIPLIGHKTTFPKFNIKGTQTIETLKHIPTSFPTIILHSPQDYVLPYDGALAMYEILQKQQNSKAYLIPVHRHVHIDMMSQNIQRRENKEKFLEIQDIACRTLSTVIDILNQHGVSNISSPPNRRNQPIFDKYHHKKHFKHISNVRLFHDRLQIYYQKLPAIPTASSLISIAVPMTMLCVSRYLQQRK